MDNKCGIKDRGMTDSCIVIANETKAKKPLN